MNDNILKELIDCILEENFINFETRKQFGRKTQEQIVIQNKGITEACKSIIRKAEDKDVLTKYTNAKLKEIEEQGIQEVQ